MEYEFNINDLQISIQHLQLFLQKYPEIQWNALYYIISLLEIIFLLLNK